MVWMQSAAESEVQVIWIFHFYWFFLFSVVTGFRILRWRWYVDAFTSKHGVITWVSRIRSRCSRLLAPLLLCHACMLNPRFNDNVDFVKFGWHHAINIRGVLYELRLASTHTTVIDNLWNNLLCTHLAGPKNEWNIGVNRTWKDGRRIWRLFLILTL